MWLTFGTVGDAQVTKTGRGVQQNRVSLLFLEEARGGGVGARPKEKTKHVPYVT